MSTRALSFPRPLVWLFLAWAMAVLVIPLAPIVAHAQGTTGCGTAVTNIAGLDNLIATMWGYLMGGPLTKVVAAGLFVFGLFGLFERKIIPIVSGFVGAFIAAFAPTIIKAIFTAAGTGAASLCG